MFFVLPRLSRDQCQLRPRKRSGLWYRGISELAVVLSCSVHERESRERDVPSPGREARRASSQSLGSRVFYNSGPDGSRDRAVARTGDHAPGSDFSSAIRTPCRRRQEARNLMAVWEREEGRSSLALARDERAVPTQMALGSDPEDRQAHRRKERPFWWVRPGWYIQTCSSPSARPWTCAVRCPRSYENLLCNLAEVSFLTSSSACWSVMILMYWFRLAVLVRPVLSSQSPSSRYFFSCDYRVVLFRGSGLSLRPVEMRNLFFPPWILTSCRTAFCTTARGGRFSGRFRQRESERCRT